MSSKKTRTGLAFAVTYLCAILYKIKPGELENCLTSNLNWNPTINTPIIPISKRNDSEDFEKSYSGNTKITKNNSSSSTSINGFDKEDLPFFYYIHVGKTGGMTMVKYYPIPLSRKKRALACLMKHPNTTAGQRHCYSPMSSESLLAERTVGHFHLGSPSFTQEEREWLLDHTNAFLVPVRDPIDRLVSAFWYHRNKGSEAEKEFFSCFADVQDLVDTVVGRRTTGNDKTLGKCQTLGQLALQGMHATNITEEVPAHFRFNFQYYENFSLERKPEHLVAVVRTEHLWNDSAALDLALGGSGKFSTAGNKFSHGSERYAYSNELSPQATRDLCCLIHREIASYQRYVLRAFNLNKGQKGETLMHVLNHCRVHYDKDPVDFPFSWKKFSDRFCGYSNVLPTHELP